MIGYRVAWNNNGCARFTVRQNGEKCGDFSNLEEFGIWWIRNREGVPKASKREIMDKVRAQGFNDIWKYAHAIVSGRDIDIELEDTTAW